MIKKKLLLVETKESKGHIALYRGQISKLAVRYDVFFATTSDFFSHFSDLAVNHVDVEPVLNLRGKLVYRVNQGAMMFAAFQAFRKLRIDRCFILAFDTVSLAILSRIFRLKKCYAFLHNNVDEVICSYIKRLFFRVLGRRIVFFAFEEYISDYVGRIFGAKVFTFEHYKRVINMPVEEVAGCSGVSGGYIFCPSSEVDYRFASRLIDYARSNGLYVVAKNSKAFVDSDNLLKKDYFYDYDKVFMGAEYIAVGVMFSYRVSGVFYEALANGKKIIFNDCLFSRSVAHKSNGSIFV